MARPVSIIELTTQESQELHRRVQASTTTRRDHLRARIILLRVVDGDGSRHLRKSVEGLAGLEDVGGAEEDLLEPIT